MCDPVTLTLAAAAVTMAGQGYSALAQNAQAKYESKVATRNAALSNEAAANAMANTREDALKHYREQARLKGAQRAAMAANGIDIDFGSAADVQADTQMLGNEDVSRIYRQGEETRRGFETQSSNYMGEAAAARSAGKSALVSGAIGMVGTALGTAKQFAPVKQKVVPK